MATQKYLKIAEMFKSIQGEGKYVGVPMVFIRTSGCTRKCTWCDSKYHKKGRKVSFDKIIEFVVKSGLGTVCFTGGEPLLQKNKIFNLISELGGGYTYKFHLETNGDLLDCDIYTFKYVSASPKTIKVAKQVHEAFESLDDYDVKVVTDGKSVGREMIKYATVLMPLSTGVPMVDKVTNRRVWALCIKSGKRYSPRLHVDLFGLKKRGV